MTEAPASITPWPALRIAAVIPCYNEALAIAQVVDEFRAVLPEIEIHVFDNASTDGTAAVARAAGAQVTHVALRGKGNVARRMFADVEADIYVMVDGDATYDLGGLRHLVDTLVQGNLDMVVGSRVDDGEDPQTYRTGHRFGNRLLTGAVAALFGGRLTDMLSGLRVFSRRYAKSFPAVSEGFEIETELTVHALELRMPFAELPVRYRSRLEGSHSKLSTYRDGWRILQTICKLFVSERPLLFFSGIATVLALGSIVAAVPLALTYLATGLVPRLPTAVLLTGTMLTAMLAFVCGIVLHAVTMGRREAKRLRYLAIPGVLHRGPVERP
ncbi:MULTISPECIES: glycosyltransferase family 2 protein [unclassified Variovorax]|uniref:glycosyltransferase family 2 protein n=1 Tax=unclassified Variovorax TaxID=663243 RepID=UPI00076D6B39|nr:MULTISPECIES: glycosyltransferase family 2 protein [unclassified Variovorax]KWT64025.1 RfbJ protein [Variovorax sp. WDL1]PNG59001.1 Undecaprenyl-phosphate mannosyltransferase [Variovorax sp. B4]PNG61208.1 Undecaprenyl-phosphate mannosyltransferase [Variovorax sp. B2]VTV12819.1 putative glucosyl-3-phosphoglycerate synthase [Variovorax sp. WDL1]